MLLCCVRKLRSATRSSSNSAARGPRPYYLSRVTTLPANRTRPPGRAPANLRRSQAHRQKHLGRCGGRRRAKARPTGIASADRPRHHWLSRQLPGKPRGTRATGRVWRVSRKTSETTADRRPANPQRPGGGMKLITARPSALNCGCGTGAAFQAWP